MDILLVRTKTKKKSTLGELYLVPDTGKPEFLCYSLEDTFRETKVYGETRIPDGKYEITLRTVGGFHERYARRFSDIHRGMLWIRDVPNFEYILIHLGNTSEDSHGCILVGTEVKHNVNSDVLINSKDAYRKIYPRIVEPLQQGQQLFITIINLEHE